MSKIVRLNPLLEVVRSDPGRITRVLLQKGCSKKLLQVIILEVRRLGIPYQFVPKKALDRLDAGHQGAVAYLTAKKLQSLEEILESAENPLLLLLDEIEDPQNLGAILRTAEAGGVAGIILPERRSASLTDTVISVSAGAAEYVSVCRVTNLVRTMEWLKARGFWIVGAEGGEKKFWYEFDYTGPVGLVLGSEGKGLRPLVRKSCDVVLSLPLLGKISSLNVASAASVFIFEAVRQRMKKSE